MTLSTMPASLLPSDSPSACVRAVITNSRRFSNSGKGRIEVGSKTKGWAEVAGVLEVRYLFPVVPKMAIRGVWFLIVTSF